MVAVVDPGDVDRLFLLIMAVLVFIMQSGFCLLEAGCITKANIDSIIFKNVLDVCAGSIAYWAIGFMLAFGGDFAQGCSRCNGFIGVQNPFLIRLPDTAFIFFFFEYCFCSAASTIISGAIAERMKWQGYILHAILIQMFVMPVVSHWFWSPNGWLAITAPASRALLSRGAMEFAGSGVVHEVGGVSAFVALFFIGYRNQFLTDEDRRTAKNSKLYLPRFEFDPKQNKWRVNELPPNDKTIATLGVWILWFGWYGFNCGSIILLNGYTGLIGRVAINTTLGGSTGAIVAIAIGRVLNNDQLYLKYNLGDLNNGLLAGIVSITSNCAFTQPWAAIAIGATGGFILKAASSVLLLPSLKLDDPVDAVSVHGACGIWGLLANGFFADPNFLDQVAVTSGRGGGLFYGFGENLIIQIIAVVCIFAWCAFWTFVLYLPMYFFDKNRGNNTYFLIRGQTDVGLGFGYHDPEKLGTKFTNAEEGTTGWINPDVDVN